MTAYQWLAATSVAFAALFLVSVILLLGDQLGSIGDPDRQFIAYYDEGSNRARDIVGAYVLVAAALSFAVFGSLAYALLREHGAGRPLALVAFGASLVVAAVMTGSAAALSSVATSILVSDVFDEDPHAFGTDVSRLATQLGFMGLVYAMWAAGLCIAALSLAARPVGLFPAWLAATGLLAAVVLLFSFFFMPVLALPLWMLALSIKMLVRRPLAPA